MPHSKFWATSRTSSRNRRSDSIRSVATTLPPRQTRAPPSDDAAVRDEAAGDDRALADPEDLADLGPTLDHLHHLRLEHALQGRVDVVRELVDDVVEPDVDALGLGGAAGGVGDLGVEPDDDRVRRRGEHDVVVGDVAGALVEDVDPHLVRGQLLEGVVDRAQRARHVRLEDDPELLGLARLDLAIQVLERRPAAAAALAGRQLVLARLDQRAGLLLVGTTRRMSPASGTSARPRTTTAVDGPAFWTACRSRSRAPGPCRTCSPTTIVSPTCSVPVWTMAVATGPRPLSSWASTIVPTAARFGFALSSWRSATSRTISSSSSMPDLGLRARRARAACRRRTPRR